MRKFTHFDAFPWKGWPDPLELERFFLSPKGQEWSYLGGNDNWGFIGEGLEGTEDLAPGNPDRILLTLDMWGHPELGVMLMYRKSGGPYDEFYSSKGDLKKLRRWVTTLQSDKLPEGLFIPFREAWKAVREFIETDGALPKSIAWIENSNLPEGTFPPP